MGKTRMIPQISNYFLLHSQQLDEEVKVWTQMFFDDGTVTQGKYISRYVFDDEEAIKREISLFLQETGRKKGVIFIWGAGRVYAKKCELLLLKGSEALRLRRL